MSRTQVATGVSAPQVFPTTDQDVCSEHSTASSASQAASSDNANPRGGPQATTPQATTAQRKADSLAPSSKHQQVGTQLNQLAQGDTTPWDASKSSSTSKYPGGDHSPSPELEADPRVQRYNYRPQLGYQVTKYDVGKTRFDRDGAALVGPTAHLNGRELPLGRAIELLRAYAQARHASVDQLLKVPHGVGQAAAFKEFAPVQGRLIETELLCNHADALLNSGQPQAAGRAVLQAASAYNRSGIAFKAAQRQVAKNTELGLRVAQTLKTAGEIAEVTLQVAGVGALTSGVGLLLKGRGVGTLGIRLAQAGVSAAVGTAHKTFNDVRDQLVYNPDQPLDFDKIGKDAATSFVQGLLGGLVGSLTSRVGQDASFGEKAGKLVHEFANDYLTDLGSTALEIAENAAKAGRPITAMEAVRQAAAGKLKTLDEQHGERNTLDSKVGVLRSLLKALVSAAR
ncbi:MAG: hypothetical protein H6707_20790 [Deltaproteobacteria bacterium]|nr:hypothetical protein [Deltaproteobacteria bacterium]